MNNKLLIALSLTVGQALAMEHMELTIDNERAMPTDTAEKKIVITIQDQERELPARFIALIGTLAGLTNTADVPTSTEFFYKEGTSLQQISLATWQHIENQLERVYESTQGNIHSKKGIIADYTQLDSRSLIDLMSALEYLDIPLLKEITLEIAQDRFTFDEILALPQYIRNEVIKRKAARPVSIKRAGNAMCSTLDLVNVNSVCVTPDEKVIFGSENKTVLVLLTELLGKHGGFCSYPHTGACAVCRGHEGAVQAVCVTPEGRIVSGSMDKTVRIWDMNGQQLAVCRGHEGEVWGVCVTPEGRIVSGSEDGTVRIWDINGQEHDVFRGHEGAVQAVCVTSEGRIVSGSKDKTVRIWDMNGQQLAVCKGHEGAVTAVCVTRDGRIVSGAEDGNVRIWDINGQELAVFMGYEDDRVMSVCVKSDNKIVSGHEDGTMTIWDINGQRLGYCWQDGAVQSVCVTPDGMIVSGCGKSINKWDDSLVDPLLNRLSVMSRKQAKLILIRMEWTKSLVKEFWYFDNPEEIIARISAHFWNEVKDILDNEELVVETKKRKELENSEDNPAKKVRLLEEELDGENK